MTRPTVKLYSTTQPDFFFSLALSRRLAGVHILFTGVIDRRSKLERSPLAQLALSMGATLAETVRYFSLAIVCFTVDLSPYVCLNPNCVVDDCQCHSCDYEISRH